MGNETKYYIGIGKKGTLIREDSVLAGDLTKARQEAEKLLKPGEKIIELREWRNSSET